MGWIYGKGSNERKNTDSTEMKFKGNIISGTKMKELKNEGE